MRENVTKMALCANLFNIRAFTYNRNQFFDACIIYLYATLIMKSEYDYLNSNKIIV